MYSTNSVWADYSFNVISVSQWVTLEEAGAVFLPAAGIRDVGWGEFSVDHVGSYGFYWSASCDNNNINYAYDAEFYSDSLDPQYKYRFRNTGVSVRLVRSAQ